MVCRLRWSVNSFGTFSAVKSFVTFFYKGFHHPNVHTTQMKITPEQVFQHDIMYKLLGHALSGGENLCKKGYKTLDSRKGSKTFDRPPESAHHHLRTPNDSTTFLPA